MKPQTPQDANEESVNPMMMLAAGANEPAAPHSEVRADQTASASEVPIRGGVLQTLRVQPLTFLRHPAHFRGGEESADDAEAFAAQLRADVLHCFSANSTP